MAALQQQQGEERRDEDDDSKQQHQGVVVVDVDNNTNNTNHSSSGSKAPRLPRWTRQEILVLIQGKKVAENRVRRGRVSGSGGVEPKWATVSSYCKRHGVNRGAVQCRKRWSNLAGDFKKIKDWESRLRGDDSESFWLMRNDLRRDRKLPGFFDREVYDILDGTSSADDEKQQQQTPSAAIIPDADDVNDNNDNVIDDDDDILQPPTTTPTTATTTTTSSSHILFDSSRSAAADDALFSSDEPPNSSIPSVVAAAIPLSAKQYYEPAVPLHSTPPPPPPSGGATEKQPAASINPEIGSTSQGDRKRRRLLMEHNHDQPEDELAQVLDKNGRILSAHLEAHNLNLKLDREQRNDHATSVLSVLNKLADALSRIADKL